MQDSKFRIQTASQGSEMSPNKKNNKKITTTDSSSRKKLISPDKIIRESVPGGISACIITLNEEKRLERCLKSLAFVDEIVVVDSGSVDKTVKIAKKYGARVLVRKFDGFVNQKNHAIRSTKKKWILSIDADEVISESLKNEILAALHDSNPEGIKKKFSSAYRFPRLSYYLGRWIYHCGWYPEYKTRLFLRNRAKFTGGTVHEILETDDPVATLQGPLLHYSYSNISDHLKRIDQYSTLIAEDKYSRNQKSSVAKAILKSFSKFLITYIYHRGFLDGRAGLVISVLGSYYNFLKYIKLWELNLKYKKNHRKA